MSTFENKFLDIFLICLYLKEYVFHMYIDSGIVDCYEPLNLSVSIWTQIFPKRNVQSHLKDILAMLETTCKMPPTGVLPC